MILGSISCAFRRPRERFFGIFDALWTGLKFNGFSGMLSGKQRDPWVEGPYIGGGNAMIPVGTKKQFKQRSWWSKSVFWWLPGHTLQTGPRNTPKLCSGGFLDPRFGLGSEMFKKRYVQQILCSTNPMFNKPYV